MYVGETHEIITDLVSDSTDKKITYQSDNEKVATVNDEGIVTAHKKGTAVITVKGGGFTEKVTVHVQKKLEIRYTIPQYVLPEANLSDIDKPTDKNSQYLGQPDMVALKDNKTLITAYPQGHGCGSLVMQVSIDAGETWTKKTDIPAGWKNSLETPTMYRLDMTDGSEKLVLITGRPNWHKNTKVDGICLYLMTVEKHGQNRLHTSQNEVMEKAERRKTSQQLPWRVLYN